MLEKIERMLAMQEATQQKTIGLDWREKNHDYHRAIYVECIELIDHIGWKWWKHQEPDLDAAKMELVDIWHFILCGLVSYKYPAEAVRLSIERAGAFSNLSPMYCAESLLLSAVKREDPIEPLFRCLDALGFSFDELYMWYIAKNALNFFRQNNGYADGTYSKIWAGKEDNEHLTRIIQEIDFSCEDAFEQVNMKLEETYQSLIN